MTSIHFACVYESVTNHKNFTITMKTLFKKNSLIQNLLHPNSDLLRINA